MTEKTYKVIWTKTGIKSLRKLDKEVAKKLTKKIAQFLVNYPYSGKPLYGELKGYRRCRYDDYRIIYQIIEEEILISIIKVGHRKEVY